MLARGVCSSRSDVWAFGVLMWEIMNDGAVPYGRMDTREIQHKVAAGTLKLKMSRSTPDWLVTLTDKCFVRNPLQRINMTDVSPSSSSFVFMEPFL